MFLSKILMHRRGGWVSRFCRNFLSHRTERKSFVKEPFCFPEIFWYRENFMDKRGHLTIFSRNFMSGNAKKFRGHSFNVSENLGYRKTLCITGGNTFLRRCFWSHSAENFRGQPFNVSENLRYQKFLCILGSITIFSRNFLVSQCRKKS